MRLEIRLPLHREVEGYGFIVEDDGTVRDGPFRCLGKADNQAAREHGNWSPGTGPDPRDDRKPFGDFPYGTYCITALERFDPPHASFGSCFVHLQPLEGDAWRGAHEGGRTGVGLHPGPLLPGEHLRPTYGCLRITEAAAVILIPLVEAALSSTHPFFVACSPPLQVGPP